MRDIPRRPNGSVDPERHLRDGRDAVPASGQYPRGTPYRPPAEPRADRARRRTLLFGAAAALLVVIATASTTALILNLAAARIPSAEPANNLPDPGPGADAGKKSVAPKQKGPAVKEKALPRTAQERFLQALGGLSAAHVYQSYLNLGLLADGVESEAYTKAEAEQMLTTVAGLIEMVDRQLDKVGEGKFTPEDQEGIERIQKLTVLLRRQGSALRAYWATGERNQITRYQEAREATWTDLSDLLGLE